MNSQQRIAETELPSGWSFQRRFMARPTLAPGKYTAHARDYVDRFHDLVRQWRLEMACSSSVMEKIENKHFRQIVQMGEWVAPLIVRELKNHRDFLFMALAMIFPSENPIPDGAKGKPHEMINAWLRWADRNQIK